MDNQNLFSKLFTSSKSKIKSNEDSRVLDKDILDKYVIKDMNDWTGVDADLIITDPPFGIEFSGKNGNYHRNGNNAGPCIFAH